MSRSLIQLADHKRGRGRTARADLWWIGPWLTAIGLLLFIGYAAWCGMQGQYYYAAPYLSPMYAPLLMTDPSAPGAAPVHMAWFGAFPDWWRNLRFLHSVLPNHFLVSPAVLILAFPASFRLTCYYYRKAYYRAFALTPPACAVGAVHRGKYRGETRLLLFQNLHRYALYFAFFILIQLTYDAVISFVKDGKLGIGVGSLVQTINAVLLGGYTLGCHSFRHLIGGRKSRMSSSTGRPSVGYWTWRGCSALNKRHMVWAWASLFWVAFTDFYIRMVSMGVVRDLNTWD